MVIGSILAASHWLPCSCVAQVLAACVLLFSSACLAAAAQGGILSFFPKSEKHSKQTSNCRLSAGASMLRELLAPARNQLQEHPRGELISRPGLKCASAAFPISSGWQDSIVGQKRQKRRVTFVCWLRSVPGRRAEIGERDNERRRAQVPASGSVMSAARVGR